MPFQIIRNDITKVSADAIVNTANPHAVIGSGTDSAIYQAAGADELLAERKKIGDIPVGKAAVTSAFRLKARYIIHTVGPAWEGGNHGELAALKSCYEESLKLAAELSCESIAFPLISTGVYGFPKDLALKAATSVIYDFLMDNDMMVFLVVFGRKAYDLSGKLFQDICSYIDDHYVSVQEEAEYGVYDGSSQILSRDRELEEIRRQRWKAETAAAERVLKPAEVKPAGSAGFGESFKTFDEHVNETGDTFQEYLLKLIIERDLKNSDVYHGANISKQHFSKIMSNRNYHPTKNTACALAIALHLDIETAGALLEKAGLVLSKSSRFDLAVEYFLLHRMYNIVSDNIILDENHLEQLGTQ